MTRSLLLSLALFLVAVPITMAGNGHYIWEEDTQHEQNRLQDDDLLDADDKSTDHKDFLGSLYERLFSKSNGDSGQLRIRAARSAPEFDIFEPDVQIIKKTTKKPSTKSTKKPTIKSTMRPTIKSTTKRPTTKSTMRPTTSHPSHKSTTHSATSQISPNVIAIVLALAALDIFFKIV